MDALYLLRDSTDDTLLETVELVEASPCANMTKTDEDTTHGLEVKCLVTAEDKDEASELDSESFDGLSLA